MRKVLHAFVFLLLYIAATTVYSASFDCKRAKTEVEKTICADALLSKLDEELAVTYRDAISKAAQADKATLRKEQAAWLKARNACKDNLCIEVMYRTRLAMLASAAATGQTEQVAAPYGIWAYGKFWLTYGRGVKVCEAYLERLNRSSYVHHPKCDRPENDEVPGFRALERVKLGAEELQRFWAPVYSFLRSGRPSWARTAETDRRVRSEMEYFPVFRIHPLVDINNDGVADPVMVWRSGNCARSGPVDQLHYWDSIPIVLNAASDGLDVERTRQIFGHPSGGYRLSSGKMASEFRPIGKNMGIFQFEGIFYLDAFFDPWGDFQGGRRNDPRVSRDDPEIQNRLAVFLRRRDETRQVCEYWFEDFSEVSHRATRQ